MKRDGKEIGLDLARRLVPQGLMAYPTTVVARYVLRAVIHDGIEQTVSYNVSLYRRRDGAIVNPLIDHRGAVVDYLRADKAFLSTYDFETKSKQHVLSLLDAIETVSATDKPSVVSYLPLLPSLKKNVQGSFEVSELECLDVTPGEEEVLRHVVGMRTDFGISLLTMDVVTSPDVMARGTAILSKTGLLDQLGGVSGLSSITNFL